MLAGESLDGCHAPCSTSAGDERSLNVSNSPPPDVGVGTANFHASGADFLGSSSPPCPPQTVLASASRNTS